MGIMPILRPDTTFAVVLQIGVSTSTSSNGKSLVTSYAIKREISSASSLKSFVLVFLSRSIVTLCRTSGCSIK